MFTFLIFLIVIAALVLSHEFGHFIVAKMKGVRVDEFGFGFPPRIAGIRFGETLYSLNLLPFGGFVRIYGEDATEESDDARNFSSRSIGVRFLIIVAGIGMNMLLAWVLFTVGHLVGLPTAVDEATENARNIAVQIVEVSAGSPAAEAGILPGDAIRALHTGAGEVRVTDIDEVQTFINAHRGEEITMRITRGREELMPIVIPRVNPPNGEGALGIAMVKTAIVSAPWYLAPWEGLKTTLRTTAAVASGLLLFFSNLIVGTVMGDIAGPVGIAQIAGQAGRLGLIYVLQLTAMLSINLAILNLLLIPALDGGRIFFLLIEKIRGVPVSARISQLTHMLGFVALIALMLLITYRDVAKLL